MTFRRGSALAPLTVVTAEGTDYMVRLTSPEGELVLEAYIRGGEILETLVPLGDFELKYASGRIREGTGVLFGSHTATPGRTVAFCSEASRTAIPAILSGSSGNATATCEACIRPRRNFKYFFREGLRGVSPQGAHTDDRMRAREMLQG